MLTLCTAPDERARCCVLRDGQRCAQPTAWHFSESRPADKSLPDTETELYTYTCGDCAHTVAAMLGAKYVAERMAPFDHTEAWPCAAVTPSWRVP